MPVTIKHLEDVKAKLEQELEVAESTGDVDDIEKCKRALHTLWLIIIDKRNKTNANL